MGDSRCSEVIVLGGDGQLGRELAHATAPAGWSVRAVGRSVADVTERAAIEAILNRTPRARAVINAAAYTAVDRAEDEPHAAFAINAEGAAHVAAACAARDLVLVQVSTDYVFDGSGARPWREDDPVAPLGVYGASKAEGEAAVRKLCERHLIVRTSWLFGAFGANFVRTMLRLAGERDRVRVVDDQTGCPTWTGHLAAALINLARRAAEDRTAPCGTFHYADAGPVTWCRFAEAIFERAQSFGLRVPDVEPILSAEYPTPARRPAYSVLSTERIAAAYGIEPQPWSDGLDRCLSKLLGERGT